MSCSEEDVSGGLLLLSKNDSLASLDSSETLSLGLNALELQHNLLGVLGFLMENWLGLSTETSLFHIVSSLSLSKSGGLTGLVLRNFVDSVTLLLWAISSNRL